MTVVSLIDYTPPQRWDATHWTYARIEESATETGSFAAIETVPLSTDLDPKNPATRSFTTHNATLQHGWYRVVWTDAALQEAPTPAVQNIDDTLPYQPPVSDIASQYLRARTKDDNGNELGDFTAATRPTYEEALRAARSAARDLYTSIGGNVPTRLVESAQAAATLLAAMKIELSYFPEQVATQRSPYRELKELFDAALKRLEAAVAEADAADGQVDEFGASGMPSYAFGAQCAVRTPGAEEPYCWWPTDPRRCW